MIEYIKEAYQVVSNYVKTNSVAIYKIGMVTSVVMLGVGNILGIITDQHEARRNARKIIKKGESKNLGVKVEDKPSEM